MGAARRLVRARLATFLVCAGGLLLAMPAVSLADGWSPTTETVTDSSGASEVATTFDAGTDLSAIWTGSAGVDSSVRGGNWPATAVDIGGSAGATSPSLAMDGGTSVAAWISAGQVVAATRSGVGGWDAPVPLSSGDAATSAQSEIVGGNPTVFWLEDGIVLARTSSGGVWSAATAPPGAPTYAITNLRVSLDSTGSGVAAWVHDTSIESATISAAAWTIEPALSTAADGTSTVAVATHGSTTAVAWNEPGNGVQITASTGDGLTVAGAKLPSLGFDSTGRLVAAYLVGSSVKGRIRTAETTWGAETALGTGSSAAPAVSGDGSGDVAVTWVGVSSVEMRAYDTTPPELTVVPPTDLAPGEHTWSATTDDLWSKSGGTISWTFSDGGTYNTLVVQHTDLTPGPVSAHVTFTDGANNSTSADVQVTIAPVGPASSSPPTVSAASAVVDGVKLTAGPGSWSGNPAPTFAYRWQRCITTCDDIAGATGTTYTLTAADVGHKVRVVETASNSGGQASAPSATTAVVAPLATGQPSLGWGADPIADGATLTASSDASDWDGAADLAFTFQFQRCRASCTPVQTSGSNTYQLRPADVGSTFQVSVIATAGPVDGQSSSTATITSVQTQAVAPKATAAPTLAGTATDTKVLTASSPDASWNGATGLTRTYVFTRCDIDGGNCAVAQSGTLATYTLTGLDLGRQLSIVVQASAGASATISSASSGKTAAISPLATGPAPAAPSGTTKDGATLTAPTVTWADQGLLTLSYQWIACSAATGCDPISGANGATYVLRAGDVGMTIEVTISAAVTAVPSVSASVTSSSTVAIQPQNTAAASITQPTPVQDGQLFSSSTGGWHGATGLDFSYVWERCDQTGSPCTAISGATNLTYTAGAADVGKTLRVTVSASKNGSAATGSPDSSQTAVVAPVSTGAPALTGSAQDGQQLTAASPDSDWDGVTSLLKAYQFYRCDSTGGSCAAVGTPSGTATYTLDWDDIGSTIKVVALASKNGSSTSTSSDSPTTSVIRPTLTAAPAAPAGAAQDGQTLSASTGSWLNQGHLSFTYRYSRCSPSCSPLGPASASNTYTLQPGDVGNVIQVAVTASIGAGATIATSSSTLAIAPLNTGVATLTAPAQQQDGQTYGTSDGAWNGATGLSIGYQWKRCDKAGNACASIQGATGPAYTAGPLDVGQTLRARVSAAKGTSARSVALADSAPTGVVAPRNTVLPSASGTPTDGQVLTASAATASAWDGVAGLSFAYQWLRCDASGGACTPITTNGTGSTYTLTPDDVAAAGDAAHARVTIRLRVSASINGASTSADSNATPMINAMATVNTTLPAMSGNAIAGTELTAAPGAWSGTGVTAVSYQWVRCDPPFSSCTNIGAPSLSGRYVIQTADIGHYVSFVETVANRLGATATRTALFSKPVISNVMQADALPVVTPPTYVDGALLATSDGAYSPTGNLAFTYKWLRCPGDINTQNGTGPCINILHATAATYRLTPDDVGSYVVSQVHATLTQDGLLLGSLDSPSELEGLPLVSASPPVNATRPAIAGVPKQDTPLTGSAGTWTGTNTPKAPITFAYQWLRCDATGGACVAIAGATASTYSPSPADVGGTLVFRVTATNSGGSQSVSSSATELVAGLAAVSTSGGAAPPAGGAGAEARGAGGGASRPATVQTDKTKPILTLAFVGAGGLTGGTTLSVNATCPRTEISCKATFHLLATLKKSTGKAVAKPVSIASISTALKSGQKKLLRLKLSSAARGVLKRSLTLKATLTASVTDAAGNVTPRQTKGLTLRWKKP